MQVIHSSWAYTSGFTRQSIMEMYRVVRPGGYIIHIVWDHAAGKDGTLLLERMADQMNWRLIGRRSAGRDEHNMSREEKRDTTRIVYQLPAYKYPV